MLFLLLLHKGGQYEFQAGSRRHLTGQMYDHF
jgi:hypothetical protein